jgi:hypothetical protein
LLGSSYNLYLSYDYKSNADCRTYLSISKAEFQNQSLVRRYRIIVPFLARAVAVPIEKVYYKLWNKRNVNDDGPIRLGFLIVNLVLMSFVGLLIYYLGKAYLLSDSVCFFVMIAVLIGGRWGSLFTGTPLTDSLYMLIVTLTLYAIKTKKNGFLILCLLLGPLSKEAYIMVIPYVFFLSDYPKMKQLIFIISGLGLAYLTRHFIELNDLNVNMMNAVKVDMDHFTNIVDSIKRIFAIRGVGELFTVFGFFTLIFIVGFTKGVQSIKSWLVYVDVLLWALIPIAFAHALLSTEVARMLYLFAAPFAIIMGLILEKHPVFLKIKSLI